uniref:Uncharacterized protein n=1 Tax=Hippocampus comes TaxID=109280 RepID=A0A3Q3DWU9_HIPCM
MEPARPRLTSRDGEQPHQYGTYAHSTTHSHGHETAAQRYSATRIQAGYEPERLALFFCWLPPRFPKTGMSS